jgi:AcrR family transcriptional regulator
MVQGANLRRFDLDQRPSRVGRITKMEVRERILDAALALLARGGAAELTQPRVARAAGIRQSHLTYYFPTRDALLQAVADRSIDALAATLMRAARRGRLGSDTLPRALARAITDKGRTRTMLALVGTADRDPEVRKRLRRFIGEARARLGGVVRAAGGPGQPEDIAFLHTLLVGCAVLHLARDDAAARREATTVLKRGAAVLAQRKES